MSDLLKFAAACRHKVLPIFDLKAWLQRHSITEAASVHWVAAYNAPHQLHLLAHFIHEFGEHRLFYNLNLDEACMTIASAMRCAYKALMLPSLAPP